MLATGNWQQAAGYLQLIVQNVNYLSKCFMKLFNLKYSA